jgi:carbonic anhydrase
MKKSFKKIVQGYKIFRNKYAKDDKSIMQHLSENGQNPKIMIVACCDSRVDPALILQCDPGDLFVVRNVANIVPPFEKDEAHHGTSAALEFGIRFLEVKHLILLGHSQCGGIQALLNSDILSKKFENDFITNWVSVIKACDLKARNVDECARQALNQSYQNCLTFPWINKKICEKTLVIHRWFFDIKTGQIFTYIDENQGYQSLTSMADFW